MNLERIPTVHPTEDEFKDIINYISESRIRRLGNKYGMIKIVPPINFKPPLSLDFSKFKFKVRKQQLNQLNLINRARLFFIKQINNYLKVNQKDSNFFCKKKYFLIDINKEKKIKLFLYDIYISIIKYYNQNITWEMLLILVRDSYNNALLIPSIKNVEKNNKLWKILSKQFNNIPISTLKYYFNKYIKDYYSYIHLQYQQNLPSLHYNDEYPKSLLSDNEESEEQDEDDSDSEQGNAEECALCYEYDHIEDLITCNSCKKYFHIGCINEAKGEKHIETAIPPSNLQNWVCRHCIMGNGYYGFHMSNQDYSLANFLEVTNSKRSFDNDNETLTRLEKEFWQYVNNIDKSKIVKYGADIHNTVSGTISGFPTSNYIPPNQKDNLKEYMTYATHPANLVNLPNSKGSLLPLFKDTISGMTIPWVYVGSEFSTFCWHMEDQYTLSANYQHEGAPKVWYSIPDSSCTKFQDYLVSSTPDLFLRQPDLMHQLTSLVSPEVLTKNGITCYKAIQNPNEYIITFPKCYHAGFNSGYNLNEAVNFTSEFWLPYGMSAINDYKVSKKQCVFEMFDLLITILENYLQGKHADIFSESLVRSSYNFLLSTFNEINKDLSRINDTRNFLPSFIDRAGLRSRTKLLENSIKSRMRVIKKNDNDENEEAQLYCTHCKTICSFAFMVHRKKGSSTMKPRKKLSADNSKNWMDFVTYVYDKRPTTDFDILCLHDYLTLVVNEKTQMFSHNSDDELYILKDMSYIDNLLNNSGDKIDRL
ncbi:similar to Saccharomyces cerevisiae YJR119C JHD2 JmjC domain family histone demethylase specific for H3-K4 (histone H3 Lys4) [Maudiozyma saulgeensis]|uniref:Similar to Saccharomyces cerevisiae YJR119C JHD2 JmjC domain family histone demethylase specific for H3-K4 (Histone H3 Lys4) n=1 Tax=Maudiozyma saulgeensis TaxID=1789683 RepID=A0A1X7R5V6_9SACH|nr:similar to Saccharomyces cerevisiae YJR119C JHD2 JmjC domain family histone demethylase specific for H3-K4 (histone H3 Lys4) [Kazachstania saulgeensis]